MMMWMSDFTDSALKIFFQRPAKLFISISLLVFTSCALFPTLSPKERPSMKLVNRFDEVSLADDMPVESLRLSAEESIKYLKKINPAKVMRFGAREVIPAELIESHRRLVAIFEEEPEPKERARRIRAQFDIFRGTGTTSGGNVLITGYFQPLLKARRQRDEIYKWPIYRRPDDLVRVNLGLFSSELKGKSITGRVTGGRLVPYYDRRAIDREGALSGRGLETAWVKDPVDLFFLSVQGSGVVEYRDGTREFVNYHAVNGRAYLSIGKLLINEKAVSKEDMSLKAIRKWLADNPDQLERVLDHNPSYVFFRAMDDGPFGSTGAKLTPGRSAAFDPSRFPKGALAHFTSEFPGVGKVGRFVFNQDQGGAIKGAGRMDLFFGLGAQAEQSAGSLKHPGELLFLVLKREVYMKIAKTR
ncbi:Membrane-bound lytic murein transglycosylase A [hydrothermal vent metagenome]|uniref:peptidoglycan lytic exotransglycosylase n=1 Tax=hydrothermal vent metagenome TaxID=652676 RepID=A0A3B1D162_9ZZZZ